MATKIIKFNYLSVERFIKDYARLCTGRIFLPTKTLLPIKTRVSINISIPNIKQVVTVEGTVLKIRNTQSAARLKKPAGMLVGLIGSPATALKNLNDVLRTNKHYCQILNLSQPANAGKTKAPKANIRKNSSTESRAASGSREDADLTIEWIREAMAQEAATREKETEANETAEPIAEKIHITEVAREKMKPSGEFLMNLTKAMLQSGYYSQKHPGSKAAKKGLFDAFKRCLEDSKEIMITNQKTRRRSDILITGILDEPVNVRTLVGSGMADLFVPKLQEYFKSKSLVSFAIKKNITPEHFESFVDIMSNPQVDGSENEKAGELLTNALIKHGITEISTVFVDDLIVLESNLPWRVEMAIQRLAKDLKVLPLFRGKLEDAIRNMRLQLILETLRLLKHPVFLKDLILNCYIIASHVENLEAEDIEKTIIDGVPLNLMLPTSRRIFDEFDRLRKAHTKYPDNPILARRFPRVQRILIWISRRLMFDGVRGAQRFLEELYLTQVLAFEDLPTDVQYLINTDKITKDVQTHIRCYVNRILQIKNSEDAAIMIKLTRRILPGLFKQADWQNALYLTKAVDKAAKATGLFATASSTPSNLLAYVFKDHAESIVAAYEKAEDSQRKILDNIADLLGVQGIAILCKVLSDSENRRARKAAMDALIKKGDRVMDWILKVLDDPGQKWFLIRNALMLLGYVGKNEQEIDRARKLLRHKHPRVRVEALNTVIKQKAGCAEDALITALNDDDDKVQWRAINGIGELSPISEPSIKKLLDMISAGPPKIEETAEKYYNQKAQLIRALGAITDISNHDEAENTILEIARTLWQQKRGFIQRMKKSADMNQSTVLAAAIATLGNIGTAKSELFLEKLAASKSSQAHSAQKAANNIRLRNIEILSNTAAHDKRPASQ